MSTRVEREWESLETAWREEDRPVPENREALRGRLRRQTAMMVLVNAGEVAVGLGCLGFSAYVAAGRPDALTLVWAAAIWVFVAAAGAFSYSNRRGVWRTEGETTRDFVELARERAARRLRTVRFVAQLLAAETAFIAIWFAWGMVAAPDRIPATAGFLVPRLGIIAAVIAVTLAWRWWFRAKAAAELDEAERLGRVLGLADHQD